MSEAQKNVNRAPQNKTNNKKKSTRRKRWQRNRPRGPRINPVSIGSNYHQNSYKFHKQGPNSVIVEGVDLLFNTSSLSEPASESHIFAVIPFNPRYWDGTKIKTQAATWQKFKPLLFEVTYTPIVPTTTSGHIVYGTMAGSIESNKELEQTLIVSNGGGLATIYTLAKSHVVCSNTTLGQASFNLQGALTDKSANPLTWFAFYSSAETQISSRPGYITVHWKFEFTDPASDTEEATTLATAPPTNERFRNPNGIGFFISMLKDPAIRILRKVAVCFLKAVLVEVDEEGGANADGDATVTELSPGTYATYMPTHLNNVVVINNVRYKVPDLTPIIAYMSGSQLTTGQPQSDAVVCCIRPVRTIANALFSVTTTADECEVQVSGENRTVSWSAHPSINQLKLNTDTTGSGLRVYYSNGTEDRLSELNKWTNLKYPLLPFTKTFSTAY